MFQWLRSKVFLVALVLTLVAGFAGGLQASSGGHGPEATQGNASKNLSNPLELRTDFAIFTLIVFLALMAVLYGVAWKPLMAGLELREKTIANQLADAKSASETAAAKLKEYEAKLSEAAVQAQDLVTQARKDAEAVANRIKADAQGEAARSRDRALAEIESAKQAALADLTSKSTDMAFALARRVVGRELKAEDHQKLISDAIGNLPSKN